MQDLPGLWIEPVSSALAGRFFTIEPPQKPGTIVLRKPCQFSFPHHKWSVKTSISRFSFPLLIQHNLVLAHLSNLTQLQSTWPFCFSLTMSLGPLLWASVWLALYHYSGNYSSSEGRSLTTLSKTYLLLSLWLLLDVLIPPFISLIRVFHHLTLRHLPIYLFIIPFSWKTLLGQGHWFVHLSTLSAYNGASTL